uniref:Ubiquitin-like protease family profile domain-containing protein n=1 Tax=Cannabis sativa TaxID=3483 RepID=A0A803PIB9_CANSA
MQAQLLHHALTREIFQYQDDEMWFQFGSKRLRFGIGEFSLITGLRCVGDVDMTKFGSTPNTISDTYFCCQDVTYELIEKRFNSTKFRDNDSAIRLAGLYLVTNYLMGNYKDKNVNVDFLNIFGSDDFETFPWGKVIYNDTLKHLQAAMKGKPKKKYFDGGITEIKITSNPSQKNSKQFKFKTNRIIPTEAELETMDIKELNFGYVSESDSEDDFEHLNTRGRMSHFTGQSCNPPTISTPKQDPDIGELSDRIQGVLMKQEKLEYEVDMLKSHFQTKLEKMEESINGVDKKVDSCLKYLDDIKDIFLEVNVSCNKDKISSMLDTEQKGGNSTYKDAITGSGFYSSKTTKDGEICKYVSNDVAISEAIEVGASALVVYDDDVVFSEKDIDMLDKKEHEAYKKYKEKINEEIEQADFNNQRTILRKRSMKPGLHLQSPFISEFGSAERIGKPKTIEKRKGLFPFSSNLFEKPDMVHQIAFNEWFKIGLQEKIDTDPLQVYVEQNLPQQTNSDCGIFTIQFAEFFLHKMMGMIPNPLDEEFYRNKLSVELYLHARKKQVGGYFSDLESD